MTINRTGEWIEMDTGDGQLDARQKRQRLAGDTKLLSIPQF